MKISFNYDIFNEQEANVPVNSNRRVTVRSPSSHRGIFGDAYQERLHFREQDTRNTATMTPECILATISPTIHRNKVFQYPISHL